MGVFKLRISVVTDRYTLRSVTSDAIVSNVLLILYGAAGLTGVCLWVIVMVVHLHILNYFSQELIQHVNVLRFH